MTSLQDQVALVTGASRGVGRGIAIALAEAGAIVFATGRSMPTRELPTAIVQLACDHRVAEEVADVFVRIRDERGRLDILVNNAWGGYERMVEGGRFTWPARFWDQPSWRWEAMIDTGVRGAFVASQHAARMMVNAGRGLIVNLSYWSAQKYMGNVIYGVAKAATDKLTADMAHELRESGVAVVSFYPGLVRTESVVAAGVFDLANSESPEFIGRVIGALAADPKTIERTGQVLVAASVASEFGLLDVDGRAPLPLTLDDA